MAGNMKKEIAQAAGHLLFEEHKKKITVKDIVEECNITRQAFYYHFEDIPDLMRWMRDQNMEEFIEKTKNCSNAKEWLYQFLIHAVHTSSFVKWGMQTNYSEEFERILKETLYQITEENVKEGKIPLKSDPADRKLITDYHFYAIRGILSQWSDEDTKNIDRIVEVIYGIIMDGGSESRSAT